MMTHTTPEDIQDPLCISEQRLCELFKLHALKSTYRSYRDFQPYNRPSNMVRSVSVGLTPTRTAELFAHTKDIDIFVAQKFDIRKTSYYTSSVSDNTLTVTLHKNPDTDKTYRVRCAFVNRHGYTPETSPEAVRIIFNAAINCITDIMLKDKTCLDPQHLENMDKALKELAAKKRAPLSGNPEFSQPI